MTEILCRELFAAAGVPVARAGHARVELNVRDAGLYVLVEGYNKRFLKQHFRDASGHLYDSEFMHDVGEPLKCSRVKTLKRGAPSSDFGAARALKRESVEGLKRESPNRADLQALAAACEERLLTPTLSSDEEERGRDSRLRSLESLLDMDRFYSFLALEIMTCHFDGYARGINNYRIYHEPEGEALERESVQAWKREDGESTPHPGPLLGRGGEGSGKMVFMPHGMDQMFYQPESSLFPELKGVVAKAVLETAEGRRRNFANGAPSCSLTFFVR